MASRRGDDIGEPTNGGHNLQKLIVSSNPFSVEAETLENVMVFRNGLLCEVDYDYTIADDEITIIDLDNEDQISVWYF